MEKIYIEIPYKNNKYSDILKETATSYCQEVNNLIYKSRLTKNNEEYERIVKDYIKDVNNFKTIMSNLIVSNIIISKYIKNNNYTVLVDENEYKKIFPISQLLTSKVEIYTDRQCDRNDVLLFLFFNDRLMYNIF